MIVCTFNGSLYVTPVLSSLSKGLVDIMKPRMLPEVDKLVAMADSGMTYQQIADKVNEENRKIMGSDYRPVGRSAVAVAMHRAGEKPRRQRYPGIIPWKVAAGDNKNQRLLLLRVFGRIKAGLPVSDEQRKSFETFARKCKETNSVVHYDPVNGWQTVKAREGVDTEYTRLTDQQIVDRGLVEKMKEKGYPFPTSR